MGIGDKIKDALTPGHHHKEHHHTTTTGTTTSAASTGTGAAGYGVVGGEGAGTTTTTTTTPTGYGVADAREEGDYEPMGTGAATTTQTTTQTMGTGAVAEGQTCGTGEGFKTVEDRQVVREVTDTIKEHKPVEKHYVKETS